MKILFVCHGNICRSPMAEFVFKHMAQGLDIYVESRATSDEEIFMGVGNKMHRGTTDVLKRNGIPFDENKRAIQLKRDEYEKFDLFIGMDRANVWNMLRIFGSDPQNKVKLLLDYTGSRGQEVDDPWYTGDFDTTYNDIKRGILALIEEIKNEVQ